MYDMRELKNEGVRQLVAHSPLDVLKYPGHFFVREWLSKRIYIYKYCLNVFVKMRLEKMIALSVPSV